jgi:hypothetical protein
MGEFFRAGGMGMYPTVFLGFLLVAASILYVVRPEPRFVAPLVGLSVTTASAGLLGFTLGLLNVLRYLDQVPEEKRFMVLAFGCEESLHPAVLALVLLVVAGFFVSIGAVRTMGLFRSPAR